MASEPMSEVEWAARILDVQGNGGYPSGLIAEGERARASEAALRADLAKSEEKRANLVDQIKDLERRRDDVALRAAQYLADLAKAKERIGELERALREADGFTMPGISRGPTHASWIAMRRQVLAAMPELRDSTYDQYT